MRRMIITLVMFISMVANVVNAQIVTRQSNPNYIVLSDGRQYWRGSVPGGAWMSPGDNFTLKVNQALQNIYTTKGAEAYQRALYNWQSATYTMVSINGGVYGGGNVMIGGGNVMVGGGNGGMVYGNGGMAGANSNVIITNDNMASTIGTGTYMNIDKNGVSISGDVVGGGLRVLHEIGGMIGSKKKNQQTTTQVVYVDSATGQVIGQQPVQTTRGTTTTTTKTRGTTTTTTVRSNNTSVQQNNNTQYQVVYNASTGQYVRVPVNH